MRISDWSSDVCSSDLLVIVVTPYLVKQVSASAIRLPTDGSKAPTDVERILLGKTFSGDSGATPPRPQTSQGASEPAPATGGTAATGPGFAFNSGPPRSEARREGKECGSQSRARGD